MSKFNATSFYRLTNNATGADRSMSCGNVTIPRDVTVNTIGTTTSENWQFLYQDGVYFIRNMVYNTSYQLGVSQYLLSAPSMQKATTDLGQQWVIDSWGDGTYRFSNQLINSGATNITYMGVGMAWNSVLMLNTEAASSWMVAANPSVGAVPSAMLQTYTSIQSASGRPTPTSTSVSATTTSITDNDLFNPGHLMPLDKAGIGIGIFVMLCVAVLIFLFYRRQKKYGHEKATAGPRAIPTQRLARHGSAEVLPEPPPSYNNRHNDPVGDHTSSAHNDVPDYYAAHRSTRRKAADEESIELPVYGQPSTNTRTFV